jgi:hypothetical protein
MIIRERRSGIDTRSEAEKQLFGERRSGVDRRSDGETAPTQPSNEQLAIFARRLRRTMRDEQGRAYFGVASAEHEFSFFPDVVRVVEWIERLSAMAGRQARPSLRKPVAAAPDRD